MGKGGSWISAIKRVFMPQSKEKLLDNGSEEKNSKKNKKGRGIFRRVETKSFIPFFRKPSSIEQILGEVDQQKLLIRPSETTEQPKPSPLLLSRDSSPRVASPRAASPRIPSPGITSPRAASPRVPSPRVTSPRAASPRVTSPRAASPRVSRRVPSPRASSPKVASSSQEISNAYRLEPNPINQHLSATKIQAVYRGFTARKSFRALRGLIRLQGVVKGQNVKRQTMMAVKHMQRFVRIQNQIYSRRIQMLEQKGVKSQAYKIDNEAESTLSKWTSRQLSEAGEQWDDSLLTKDQVEARLQKKVEAIIKRERTVAYGYSHQLWKTSSKPSQRDLKGVRPGAFPWWWSWLESQATTKNVPPTPPRPTSAHRPSPSPRSHTSNYKHSRGFGLDNFESLTPRSSKSTVPFRSKQLLTPTRTRPATSSLMKDDESLTSCPQFSVPNYMAPTISAKAKARASSSPKGRFPGTPGSEPPRRFSFPLTPNAGSFKWNKRPGIDSVSQMGSEKHQTMDDRSVDSTISMPAAVGLGRKPFNRFA